MGGAANWSAEETTRGTSFLQRHRPGIYRYVRQPHAHAKAAGSPDRPSALPGPRSLAARMFTPLGNIASSDDTLGRGTRTASGEHAVNDKEAPKEQVYKYSVEPFLEYTAVDRFLFRANDLHELEQCLTTELRSRVSSCKIYLIARRPRVSLVPDSVKTTETTVAFDVEVRRSGVPERASVAIARSSLGTDEVAFETSAYPHRELVSKAADGTVIGTTLLANIAHLLDGLPSDAKRLEVVYVGQGTSNSATDRLKNHSTLQRVLGDASSNHPDDEVFCLLYEFEMKKSLIALRGVAFERSRTPDAIRKITEWRPTLKDQVSMVEGALVAHFQTKKYNKQLLNFPQQTNKCLRKFYELDLPAIVVNIDHSSLSGLEFGNSVAGYGEAHQVVADFRQREGKPPFRSLVAANGRFSAAVALTRDGIGVAR